MPKTDLNTLPVGYFNNFIHFSSTYANEVLTQFLPKVKNMAYERFLEIQQHILNDVERHWNLLTDGIISPELNGIFGFPEGTRYFQLDNFTLPISNKKLYLRTYGAGNIDIPGLDFYRRADIFDRVFRMTVGDYYFDNFDVIVDKFGRAWVVIKADATLGITATTMQTLGDVPVFFWMDKHSSIFQEFVIFSSAIVDSDDSSMAAIRVTKNSAITNLPIPINDNTWDIALTADLNGLGRNLAYMCHASLYTYTNDGLVFHLPVEFVNFIKSKNPTVKITAIHRKNRRYSYTYSSADGTQPVLYLAEGGNPIPASNIKVYKYDKVYKKTGERISIENIKPKFFPAVYDFTSLISTNDIFIEIIDYPPMVTNTKFANHLQPVIDAIGTETYRASMIEGLLSTYAEVAGFDPINVSMTNKEFMEGPYNKDIREYKLRKLIELIQSDPWIYMEYTEFIDSLRYGAVIEAGTPKHFKLNTGMVHQDLSYPAGAVVNDTSLVAVAKKDDIIHFDEPHTYFKLHVTNPNCYVRVFVNGSLVTPSYIGELNNDIYVYLPQSKLAYLLAPYAEETDSLFISNAQLVIVEILPFIDRNNRNAMYDSLMFNDVGEFTSIFDGAPEDMEVRLNDLIFTNSATGEFIDPSKFDFQFILHSADLEFDDGTVQTVTGSTRDILYLYTKLAQVYLTQDNQAIILDQHKEQVDPEFDESGTPGTGVITGIDDIMNKSFNIHDILIALKDPSLLGVDIIVGVSRSAIEWDIDSETGPVVETDMGEITTTVGGFYGHTDDSRILVYANGTLLHPTFYSITLPKDSDGTISVKIAKSASDEIKRNSPHYVIQLRYLPIKYSSEIGSLISSTIDDRFFWRNAKCPAYPDPDTLHINVMYNGQYAAHWYDSDDVLHDLIHDNCHTNKLNLGKLRRKFRMYGGEIADMIALETYEKYYRVSDIKRDAGFELLLPEWPINNVIDDKC